MKVKFIADWVTQDQINWGSHCDPRGVLDLDREYEIDYAEVHSQHTKIFLKFFPRMSFNSVWFDIKDVMTLPRKDNNDNDKRN